MASPTRLSVTTLEDRSVPAILGVAWPDPQNLSVSFAPDGTDVGGTKSTLTATLNAVAGRGRVAGRTPPRLPDVGGRHQHRRACGCRLGGAFGGTGLLQANPTQGDIRVAARALSADTVAVASPPDLVSGWPAKSC